MLEDAGLVADDLGRDAAFGHPDPEQGDEGIGRGRYIERTQIYAKREPVCAGGAKHLFVAQW
jgi:hypothetical protein